MQTESAKLELDSIDAMQVKNEKESPVLVAEQCEYSVVKYEGSDGLREGDPVTGQAPRVKKDDQEDDEGRDDAHNHQVLRNYKLLCLTHSSKVMSICIIS